MTALHLIWAAVAVIAALIAALTVVRVAHIVTAARVRLALLVFDFVAARWPPAKPPPAHPERRRWPAGEG